MANKLVTSLSQQIDRISSSYEISFSMQPRATRDLAQLDDIIKKTREVIAQFDRVPFTDQDAEYQRLVALAKKNLEIYRTERQAISEAQAVGPEFQEFSQLGTAANFIFARYFRLFAGQERGTRDIALLTEMVEELRGINQRMRQIAAKKPHPDFQRDVEITANALSTYETEIREIEKAYKMGSAEDQAGRLALFANSQFDIYRHHFAGLPLVTRRPALLQRVIENLRKARSAMRALESGGLKDENNKNNITIVEKNLATYEETLREIRKARQAAPLVDIMGMLGGAANEVFDEYRQKFSGKDRRTVDLATLSILCDKLGEIARQMAELGRTEANEMNTNNLQIVTGAREQYEQEYREVAKAQQTQT